MTPIFIFSLPRSGSTLLQRMLATHEDVATVSEPWLLLPFLYALNPRGVVAEYSHRASQVALQDFVSRLPAGAADYREAVAQMALTLYGKAARNRGSYFLDKTPRYHLVCEQVIEMFPQGKFIFLWRNPLAMIASICESFCQGRWKLREYGIDTHRGMRSLTAAFERFGEQAISVNFEKLVQEPASELERIGAYIGIDGLAAGAEGLATARLEGRLGDRTGVEVYGHVSMEPLTKWHNSIGNAFRVNWCRSYLASIGAERLTRMGYDQDELIAQLAAVPTRNLTVPVDWWHHGRAVVTTFLKKKVLG